MREIIDIKSKEVLNERKPRVKVDLIRYWDREYVNERIDLIDNHKYKMLVKFLWLSGVRITECINLRKCDIDFQKFTMNVKWLKSRKYNNRIVPIHPLLRDLLQLYTAPLKFDEKVFPFTRQRAWQITKKYLDGNPHKLRHSFAVNWLRSKCDIYILHKVLGHSKIQTTMEYLKIIPEDQGKELLKVTF